MFKTATVFYQRWHKLDVMYRPVFNIILVHNVLCQTLTDQWLITYGKIDIDNKIDNAWFLVFFLPYEDSICSLFVQKSNLSVWVWMGSVYVWLSHQQGCIPGNRKRCDQEREKGGHHSYRLSQRNTGEENFFFTPPSFPGYFEEVILCPMRACHCPKVKIILLALADFTVSILFFSPHPLPPHGSI